MILNHLTIIHYRNIAHAELDFSDKINCFIGNNGQGKTNILDAIHFLSLCKSSLASQDGLNILHNQEMCSLKGYYTHEDATKEVISCGIKRGQKKIVRRGDKVYKRLADHIGLIPLVMISPSDELLIAGGSEYRRKFLDLIISQYNPSYLNSLMRYNKALLQRNTLLKQTVEVDEELFTLWEEEMALEAKTIYACRASYMEDFLPIFQQYYSTLSDDLEQVKLNYISHLEEGDLACKLRNSRPKERILGHSICGIHKDDLEMTLAGYPIHREGSQGQNKTFLLALKLAQYSFLKQQGTTPLLLLDDVFDKLDAQRVERLVKLVSGDEFGQIFMTDTDREHLAYILSLHPSNHQLFHVKEGAIE